jgi:hypothetical protein
VRLAFVAAVLALAACATPKKLVEFGWDEPSPAFMRAHLDEMEQTPFDGCVFHIDNFTWLVWGTKTFTEADVRASLEDLKATPFRRFTENFLRFNTTPAKIDWFDDHAAVMENARLAAHVAREGKCRGILFDIEQYDGQLFNYRKQRDAASRPWDAYAAQVRRRGREVMEAFQEGYPGLVVFLTFGYSLPWHQSQGQKPLADCSYGLLAPFMDGLVEAARGGTRIVDGYELSYAYKELEKFEKAYATMKDGLLSIVAEPGRYREVTSFGFGIWLDDDWRKKGWSVEEPDKNYFPPAAFEASVRRAFERADHYVWVYTETPRWWSKEGGPQKLPPEYDAALRRARPDR